MRRDAAFIYYLMSFIQGLAYATIFTISQVYYVLTVGLNPLQLVLVGTTVETTVLFFEIPTGVVADVYSRRLSTIIGILLTGVAFMIEGSFPFFRTVLIAQVVWGVGATFISGAWSAWITDEIGPEKVGPVYMRGSQWGEFGGFLGIFVSAGLGSIALNTPIQVGAGIFLLLGLFLIFTMPENGFQPAPVEDRETFRTLTNTLRGGFGLVRKRPLLLIFVVMELFLGLFSEGFDRLWTPHLLQNFTFPDWVWLPITMSIPMWFAAIELVGKVLGIGATGWMRPKLENAPNTRLLSTLQIISGLQIIALFGLAFAGGFWAAISMLWIFSTLRTISWPMTSTWINRHIDSNVRATVLSLSAQANAFGQVAGGPGVGWLGVVRSLRTALGASALLLFPLLPLYRRAQTLENNNDTAAGQP